MSKWPLFWIASLIIGIFLYKSWQSYQEPITIPDIQTSIDIESENLFYFCTASDRKYFYHLLNLIGSIHKHHFKQLGQIAVFDLGLKKDQLQQLSTIKKVSIYSIEKTNPFMLSEFSTRPNVKKPVPGWYSWKPVAIKQAFDIFPPGTNFLWIDAGITILRDISDLFEYLKYEGYFFHNGWDWSIKQQTTHFVINALNLNSSELSWLLSDTTKGLETNLMGFSAKIYQSLVYPIYTLTTDIRYFEDDGTAPGGFGNARHDQSLFSIYVRNNHLKVVDHFENPKDDFLLTIGSKKIPYHIASFINWLTEKTHIYCSRYDLGNFNENLKYIQYDD